MKNDLLVHGIIVQEIHIRCSELCCLNIFLSDIVERAASSMALLKEDLSMSGQQFTRLCAILFILIINFNL